MSRIERALKKAGTPAAEKPLLDVGPVDVGGERASEVRIEPSTVDERIVAVCDPTSSAGEHFRRLKVKLRLIPQRTRSVLLTSAVENEGKSTTWFNLAVTMAQGERRVILVDADLRRPHLHEIFGLPNDRGLTTMIVEGAALDDPPLTGTLRHEDICEPDSFVFTVRDSAIVDMSTLIIHLDGERYIWPDSMY